MRREAKVMRGDGDTIFAQVKTGVGVEEIKALILAGYEAAKQTAVAPVPAAAAATSASS